MNISSRSNERLLELKSTFNSKLLKFADNLLMQSKKQKHPTQFKFSGMSIVVRPFSSARSNIQRQILTETNTEFCIECTNFELPFSHPPGEARQPFCSLKVHLACFGQ